MMLGPRNQRVFLAAVRLRLPMDRIQDILLQNLEMKAHAVLRSFTVSLYSTERTAAQSLGHVQI